MPDDEDLYVAVTRRVLARERLIKQALLLEADQLCVQEDDPGWNAEYLEEQLEKAAREFIGALDG